MREGDPRGVREGDPRGVREGEPGGVREGESSASLFLLGGCSDVLGCEEHKKAKN